MSGGTSYIMPGLETAAAVAAIAMGQPEIGIPLLSQGLSGIGQNAFGTAGPGSGGSQMPLGFQTGQGLSNLTGSGGVPQSQSQSSSLAGLSQLSPIAQMAQPQQRQLAPQAPEIGAPSPVLPPQQGGIVQIQAPNTPILGGASAGNLMNQQGQVNAQALRQILEMMTGGGGMVA